MTPSDQEEAERRYPAPRTDITAVQRAAYIKGREDERAAGAASSAAGGVTLKEWLDSRDEKVGTSEER